METYLTVVTEELGSGFRHSQRPNTHVSTEEGIAEVAKRKPANSVDNVVVSMEASEEMTCLFLTSVLV